MLKSPSENHQTRITRLESQRQPCPKIPSPRTSPSRSSHPKLKLAPRSTRLRNSKREDPDKANALQAEDHYYAALDHVGEGRDQQAVDEYRQALAADPTFVDALHGLSRALQNLNRLDEAIAVANQLSALDPDDVLAHTSLSILYQKKAMIPEAEAEANKARILGWKQQLKGK